MTEGEAIASPNPFHHLFTAGAQPFEHTINPEQHFVHPHWVNGYDHYLTTLAEIKKCLV
jgi:hypothetical protein